MKIIQTILILGIIIFAILIGILAWQRYQYKPQIELVPETIKIPQTNTPIYPEYEDGKG